MACEGSQYVHLTFDTFDGYGYWRMKRKPKQFKPAIKYTTIVRLTTFNIIDDSLNKIIGNYVLNIWRTILVGLTLYTLCYKSLYHIELMNNVINNLIFFQNLYGKDG